MSLQIYKIASVEVGSAGAATIDFTSIPQGYRDLKLVISLRATSGNTEVIRTRFNGSSATTYTYKTLRGSGTSATSWTESTWGNTLIMSNYSGGAANIFSNGEIYIPNYAGSTNKSVSIDAVQEDNTSVAYCSLVAGLWSNTAAINQITITVDTTNLAQYSKATLYGIL